MRESAVARELEREWQGLVRRLARDPMADPRTWADSPRRAAMRRTILYAQLEDVRLAWTELRRSVRLERYATRYVTPAWTLTDLIGHVATWSKEMRREIETGARGGTFDYVIPFALSVIGPNEWNQVQVEQRKGEALGAFLDEIDAETRRMEDLVLGLPEDTLLAPRSFPFAPTGDPGALWTGTIAQIALMKCRHDTHHLDRIRQWLENLR